MSMKICAKLVATIFCTCVALSQQAAPPASPTAGPPASDAEAATADDKDYRIGAQDVVDISIFGVPAMNASVRVQSSGNIEYQPIGTIMAAGLTERELARVLEIALRDGYLKEPRVTTLVKEYSSQPVANVGAVINPKTYQLRGEKTLLDILAEAGDRTEAAGLTIQVLRQGRTIEINSIELFQKGNAALDIPILAGDKINVLYAQYVTVVGEVNHQGQFPLKGGSMKVRDAWALAGGQTPNAKMKEGVILRELQDGKVEDINIDIVKLLNREVDDIPMMAGDVLYIPGSAVRTGVRKVMDSLLSVAIGRAVYTR
jgi:polysaccharide export outer membrane protein